jgi:F-box-like
MEDVLEQIFQEMDAETLLRAELVSTHWRLAILHSRIWSRIFEDKVQFIILIA